MPETPQIVHIRARLPDALLPYTTARQRHLIAITAFDVIIAAIERGVVSFDDWERSSIFEGLRCIRGGFYEKALAEAKLTLKPRAERRSRYLSPKAPDKSIADLRGDLEFLRVQLPRQR